MQKWATFTHSPLFIPFFFFTVIEYRKLFFHLIISHLSSWKSMNEDFSGRVMDVYLKVITVEKFRNGKTSGARGPRAGRPWRITQHPYIEHQWHRSNTQPSHGLFTLLPSGRRYRSVRRRTTTLQSSFVPQVEILFFFVETLCRNDRVLLTFLWATREQIENMTWKMKPSPSLTDASTSPQ